MPTAAELRQELAELEELDALEAKAARMTSSGQDALARQAAESLQGGFQQAANYAGKAMGVVDAFTGAPIRAGISKTIETYNPIEGAKAAYKQFGTDPTTAPSGKQIAEQLGIPGDEYALNTGLILNPFTNETLKVSPSGAVGAGIETLTDPLSYVGPGLAKGAVKAGTVGLEAIAPRIGEALTKEAELRAAKAATGQSVKHIRQMAGLTSQGGDAIRAEKQLRGVGRELLAADEAGAPVIGYGNKIEDIAKKAGEKKKFFGQEIGKVGENIDQAFPQGSVDLGLAAQNLLKEAEKIPEVGNGRRLKERLLEEAATFEKMGKTTFKDAQAIKNQFQFKATDPDALYSNQDIVNMIKRSVTKQMDDTVSAISKTAKGAQESPVNAYLLDKYPELKKSYAAMRGAESAASAKAAQNLANRYVPPSSYMAGGATLAGTLASGGTGGAAFLQAAAVGAANKLMMERGGATIARSLNGLGKALSAAPESLAKYQKTLNGAASRGTQALVASHHLLMNNDPEYRNIIENYQGDENQ